MRRRQKAINHSSVRSSHVKLPGLVNRCASRFRIIHNDMRLPHNSNCLVFTANAIQESNDDLTICRSTTYPYSQCSSVWNIETQLASKHHKTIATSRVELATHWSILLIVFIAWDPSSSVWTPSNISVTILNHLSLLPWETLFPNKQHEQVSHTWSGRCSSSNKWSKHQPSSLNTNSA